MCVWGFLLCHCINNNGLPHTPRADVQAQTLFPQIPHPLFSAYSAKRCRKIKSFLTSFSHHAKIILYFSLISVFLPIANRPLDIWCVKPKSVNLTSNI